MPLPVGSSTVNVITRYREENCLWFRLLSLSPYALLLFFSPLRFFIVSISLNLSARTAHCYFLFYATHPHRPRYYYTASRPPWPFLPCPTLSRETASEDRNRTPEPRVSSIISVYEYEYEVFPRFNPFHAPTRSEMSTDLESVYFDFVYLSG